MKYKFEKIDDDITKLSYKDKEFEIKRDVELTAKMQGVYMKARTKMMIDLSKQGITKKDLVIEKKENGKKYYDNSNLDELEKYYTEMAFLEIYDEISKEATGMIFQELILDIGLNENESEGFGLEFSNALLGNTKTPSEKK
jgi:hypothetical protein